MSGLVAMWVLWDDEDHSTFNILTESRLDPPMKPLARTFLLAGLALAALAAFAQQPGPSFRPALPGYIFEFPRDHGTHDEYRTEWWYYTGQLRTESGKEYGFEVTFFR
ncbi:MAG TPA: lipocalin-like domain-containing protein, partial [Thermoanaerobaculia bacterium]|nr:lipocalin-like domain-containing protein [Thermoanaerobaculia bacterium]